LGGWSFISLAAAELLVLRQVLQAMARQPLVIVPVLALRRPHS
jgi:hypothetical protein